MDLGASGIMIAPPSGLRTEEELFGYFGSVFQTLATPKRGSTHLARLRDVALAALSRQGHEEGRISEQQRGHD
jgi:hypothetical protein